MIINKFRIIKRYDIPNNTHNYHLQKRNAFCGISIGWRTLAVVYKEEIARSWMFNLQAFVYEECPITKRLNESFILTKDQEIWQLARRMAWKEGIDISHEQPDFSITHDPWYLKARNIFEWLDLV